MSNITLLMLNTRQTSVLQIYERLSFSVSIFSKAAYARLIAWGFSACMSLAHSQFPYLGWEPLSAVQDFPAYFIDGVIVCSTRRESLQFYKRLAVFSPVAGGKLTNYDVTLH